MVYKPGIQFPRVLGAIRPFSVPGDTTGFRLGVLAILEPRR